MSFENPPQRDMISRPDVVDRLSKLASSSDSSNHNDYQKKIAINEVVASHRGLPSLVNLLMSWCDEISAVVDDAGSRPTKDATRGTFTSDGTIGTAAQPGKVGQSVSQGEAIAEDSLRQLFMEQFDDQKVKSFFDNPSRETSDAIADVLEDPKWRQTMQELYDRQPSSAFLGLSVRHFVESQRLTVESKRKDTFASALPNADGGLADHGDGDVMGKEDADIHSSHLSKSERDRISKGASEMIDGRYDKTNINVSKRLTQGGFGDQAFYDSQTENPLLYLGLESGTLREAFRSGAHLPLITFDRIWKAVLLRFCVAIVFRQFHTAAGALWTIIRLTSTSQYNYIYAQHQLVQMQEVLEQQKYIEGGADTTHSYSQCFFLSGILRRLSQEISLHIASASMGGSQPTVVRTEYDNRGNPIGGSSMFELPAAPTLGLAGIPLSEFTKFDILIQTIQKANYLSREDTMGSQHNSKSGLIAPMPSSLGEIFDSIPQSSVHDRIALRRLSIRAPIVTQNPHRFRERYAKLSSVLMGAAFAQNHDFESEAMKKDALNEGSAVHTDLSKFMEIEEKFNDFKQSAFLEGNGKAIASSTLTMWDSTASDLSGASSLISGSSVAAPGDVSGEVPNMLFDADRSEAISAAPDKSKVGGTEFTDSGAGGGSKGVDTFDGGLDAGNREEEDDDDIVKTWRELVYSENVQVGTTVKSDKQENSQAKVKLMLKRGAREIDEQKKKLQDAVAAVAASSDSSGSIPRRKTSVGKIEVTMLSAYDVNILHSVYAPLIINLKRLAATKVKSETQSDSFVPDLKLLRQKSIVRALTATLFTSAVDDRQAASPFVAMGDGTEHDAIRLAQIYTKPSIGTASEPALKCLELLALATSVPPSAQSSCDANVRRSALQISLTGFINCLAILIRLHSQIGCGRTILLRPFAAFAAANKAIDDVISNAPSAKAIVGFVIAHWCRANIGDPSFGYSSAALTDSIVPLFVGLLSRLAVLIPQVRDVVAAALRRAIVIEWQPDEARAIAIRSMFVQAFVHLFLCELSDPSGELPDVPVSSSRLVTQWVTRTRRQLNPTLIALFFVELFPRLNPDALSKNSVASASLGLMIDTVLLPHVLRRPLDSGLNGVEKELDSLRNLLSSRVEFHENEIFKELLHVVEDCTRLWSRARKEADTLSQMQSETPLGAELESRSTSTSYSSEMAASFRAARAATAAAKRDLKSKQVLKNPQYVRPRKPRDDYDDGFVVNDDDEEEIPRAATDSEEEGGFSVSESESEGGFSDDEQEKRLARERKRDRETDWYGKKPLKTKDSVRASRLRSFDIPDSLVQRSKKTRLNSDEDEDGHDANANTGDVPSTQTTRRSRIIADEDASDEHDAGAPANMNEDPLFDDSD